MHSTITPVRARTTQRHDDVTLVSWPSEDHVRAELASRGVPRLLLVEPGVAAPAVEDPLEDWVREPADPVEVQARTATVRQRATLQADRPTIEDDRVLRGDRWVAVPRSQLPVVALLLDRMGAVVPWAELRAAYGTGAASATPAALKAMIRRLKKSLGRIGLAIVNVRDRGYLLVEGGAEPEALSRHIA